MARRREQHIKKTHSSRDFIFLVEADAKLSYLVKVRGDQRPRDRSEPLLVAPTRDKDGYQLPRERLITSDSGLGQVIDLTSSDVCHVKDGSRGLRPGAVKVIAKIYAVDMTSLIYDSFEVFRAVCEGHLADPEIARDWRKLVRNASQDECTVSLQSPFRNRRFAKPRPVGQGPKALPQIPVETPFWIGIHSPTDAQAKPFWGAFHILMLNHDVEGGGFGCVLPRYAQEFEFLDMRYPAAHSTLWFPRAQMLTHRPEDRGEFEMISVISEDPAPAEIIDSLRSSNAEGPAIGPALAHLARWLAPRLGGGKTSVAKVRYEVVARQPEAA